MQPGQSLYAVLLVKPLQFSHLPARELSGSGVLLQDPQVVAPAARGPGWQSGCRQRRHCPSWSLHFLQRLSERGTPLSLQLLHR